MKLSKSVLSVCLIGLSLIVHGVYAGAPNTVIGCVENNYNEYPNCPFNIPFSMALTPDGKKAYVCNGGKFNGFGSGLSSVSIIDVATDTVTGCVENNYGEYPNCPFNGAADIAITPDGTKAYVCNEVGNSVSVIDVATDTVIGCVTNDYAEYPACPFNHPFGIAITPINITPAKVYVLNSGGNNGEGSSVTVIDVATDTVIGCVQNNYAEYPSCPFNGPLGIAITPDGKKAYVCNVAVSGAGSISIIDVATDTVIGCVTNDYAEYPNCPFNQPFSIVITPNGKKAYVTNEIGNSVSVIDVATDTVIGCITNDDYASCAFTDPAGIDITPDGTTVYVCNLGTGTVAIIDVATDTVIGCVENNYAGCQFVFPYGLFITLDGSKAYVANVLGNSVSIIGLSATPANPPTNVQGVRHCYGTELILTITWTASTTPTVSSYNIYNGATLVGNVLATSPLTFSIPLVSPDEGLNFFVSAVGPESTKVPVPTYGPMDCSPPPSILPPASVNGCKTQNIFLLQTDFINNITWTAPTSGSTPVAYKIYRDPALTQLVATVPASGTLQFFDHDRNPGIVYSYYIVSVDANGNVSTANSVTVTNPC